MILYLFISLNARADNTFRCHQISLITLVTRWKFQTHQIKIEILGWSNGHIWHQGHLTLTKGHVFDVSRIILSLLSPVASFNWKSWAGQTFIYGFFKHSKGVPLARLFSFEQFSNSSKILFFVTRMVNVS